MSMFKYRYHLYRHLKQSLPKILEEARKAADEIGIPKEWRGKFGLTGAISGCHGLISKEVDEAISAVAREVIPNRVFADEIRDIVKDHYGDEYDALLVSTCEAALWLSFDVLVSPPFTGRGDKYRTRYIVPYERHLHHHGGYGRPFPPQYKDIFADRGCTAGELGFYGKRLENVDVVIVPMVGARYTVHGIKYHPTILLSGVKAEETAKRIRQVRNRTSRCLQVSLLSDTTRLAMATVRKIKTVRRYCRRGSVTRRRVQRTVHRRQRVGCSVHWDGSEEDWCVGHDLQHGQGRGRTNLWIDHRKRRRHGSHKESNGHAR